VNGTTVPQGPQQFVVVANAELGSALEACTDVTEPNDTAATAFGPLPIAVPVSARICSGDADYFSFTTNLGGAVSVALTSTDSPLRATLFANGTQVSQVTVAAGTSQTLTTTATAATTTYVVKVEASGTLGATGGYTLVPTYPFNTPQRHRAARR
jgi:hypothetical protein